MDNYLSGLGSEPHGDPEAHSLANIYFNNLRNSENGYQVSMNLLTQMIPCDQLVKYHCLDIIENYICKSYIIDHTNEEKNQMKNFLLSYTHIQGRQHPKRFFDSEDNRNKAARIFGIITAQCTDSDVSADVFDVFLTGPSENFVRSDLFLRILRQIAALVLIPEYITTSISLMRPNRLITSFLNIINETCKNPKQSIAQELQGLCLRVIRIYAPWLNSACETLTRAALPCLPDIDAIRCIASLVRTANYCLMDNVLNQIEPVAKKILEDSKISDDYSKQTVLIEISNLLASSGLRILNLASENPKVAEDLIRRVIHSFVSQFDVPNLATACNISLRCISFVTRLVRDIQSKQIFAKDLFIDDLLNPILEKIQVEKSGLNSFITMYCNDSDNCGIELHDFDGSAGLDYFGNISFMKLKPRRLRECLATLICIVSKLSSSYVILRLEKLINILIKQNTGKENIPFLIAELPLTLVLIIPRIISQSKQENKLNSDEKSTESVSTNNLNDNDSVLNRIIDVLLENPQIASNDLIMIRYIESLINCVLQLNICEYDKRIAPIIEHTISSFGLQNLSSKGISLQAASFLHELISVKGHQVAISVPQLSVRLKNILEFMDNSKIRLLLIESIAKLIQDEPSNREERKQTLQFLITPAINELKMPFKSDTNIILSFSFIYSMNNIAFALREITGILRAFDSPNDINKCDGISILIDTFPLTIPYLSDKSLHPLLLQLFYQYALSLHDYFLPLLSKTLLILRSSTNFISLLEYMSFYAKMIRFYGMKIVHFLSEDFQPAGEHIFKCLADYTSNEQTGHDEIFQTAFLNFLTSLTETNTLVPILQEQSKDFNKKVFSLLVISSNDFRHLDAQLQSLTIFQAICKNFTFLKTLPSNFFDFLIRDIVLVCIKGPFKLYTKLIYNSKLSIEISNPISIKKHENEDETGLNEIINESVNLLKIIHESLGDQLIKSLRKNILPYLSLPSEMIEEFICNLINEEVNFNYFMRQFIEQAKPFIIQEHYPIKSIEYF